MVTYLETIALVIFCHLVGDYVLQSNFIASTKGDNWYHLFVHCVLYTIPFYICFGFNWKLIILFATHLIIDPFKARYNKLSYTGDQLLHYAVVFILYVI